MKVKSVKAHLAISSLAAALALHLSPVAAQALGSAPVRERICSDLFETTKSSAQTKPQTVLQGLVTELTALGSPFSSPLSNPSTARLANTIRDELDKEITFVGRRFASTGRFETTPMESIYVGEQNRRGIQYFKRSALSRLQLFIKDGLVYDSKGNLFDTKEASISKESGLPEALFVMNEKGELFALRKRHQRLHRHSSFFSGGAVAAAGTLSIENGVVKRVSNLSGHYLPEPELLAQALYVLEAGGTNLRQIDIEFPDLVNSRRPVRVLLPALIEASPRWFLR